MSLVISHLLLERGRQRWARRLPPLCSLQSARKTGRELLGFFGWRGGAGSRVGAALAELGEIWEASLDKEGIQNTATRINTELTFNPLEAGESRSRD